MPGYFYHCNSCMTASKCIDVELIGFPPGVLSARERTWDSMGAVHVRTGLDKKVLLGLSERGVVKRVRRPSRHLSPQQKHAKGVDFPALCD